MSAKTYDTKTAAFGGWLIQNVPADLTDADMNRWMNDSTGMKKFLAGLKSSTSSIALLSVIATTQLGATIGNSTSTCFTRSMWRYRDSDFDRWLAKKQQPAAACTISTIDFKESWTFVGAAAKVLGIGAGSSVKLIGRALIENGHTMTLTQIEEMVEATERGENTGMRTDGYGNFAFVETGNEDDSVSVARVFRDASRWYAHVYRLGRDYRWLAGFRLLVRNLDASRL